MNKEQEMEKQLPPKWRLLRALCLLGHPKIKPLACWMFFIPQLLIYLYLLGPVFVYYTKGVPPKESLEVITGTWREEGKLGGNRNGLVAPQYFVDTESGSHKVHCGFPMQKQLCHFSFGGALKTGQVVKVYYDKYFGILSYEHLDRQYSNISRLNMAYDEGVFMYAQEGDTIKWNYGAHYMLAYLLVAYGVIVYQCRKASFT